MSMVLRECISATGLLLLFLGVIAVSECLSRTGRLAPEIARKTIHLAGGLGCLLFPFLIASWVTVLVLASIFAVILYLGENRKWVHALSSVDRLSYGSLLFPVSILILYVVGQDRIWLYIAGLLVLVLADTAAALAGTRLGSIFFRTGPGEKKSAEGSLAFCVVGFFAVYLPLLLLSDIPHLTCILTGLLMAFLLAALEAVSIGGTDNLFVPLATAFLLLKLPSKPQGELLFQLVSFCGITYVIHRINHKYRTLGTRLLIIFILALYAAWSLGSADWLLPLLAGFILYNRLCRHCRPLPTELTARELLRPLLPSLCILFAANATLTLEFWFAPYLIATSIAFSLCTLNRFLIEPQPLRLNGLRLGAVAILPSLVSLLLCLPIQGRLALPALAATLLLCALPPLLYRQMVRIPLSRLAWNYAIPIIATSAALAYAALQHWGVIPPMAPSTWMELFRCQS